MPAIALPRSAFHVPHPFPHPFAPTPAPPAAAGRPGRRLRPGQPGRSPARHRTRAMRQRPGDAGGARQGRRRARGQAKRPGGDHRDRQGPAGAARHPAIADGGDREADRRPQARHPERGAAQHRQHQLPGRRGRRGGHPPARLLAVVYRRHLCRRHPRPRLLRARHLQPRSAGGAARLGIDAVRPRLYRWRGQPGQQGAADLWPQ